MLASTQVLAHRTTGRDNNFNLIRFMAAILVMLSHAYPLSGHSGEPLSRLGLSYGFVAVDVFFVISGFLVTGSLFSRADLPAFFRSRCLRIFPALAVCNLVCVGMVGLFFTRLSLWDYLCHGQLLRYLVNNTLLLVGPLEAVLPGVFTDLPFRYSVNGSLWTLPHELRLYLLVAFCGVLAFVRGGLIGTQRIRIAMVGLSGIAMAGYLSLHTMVCAETFQAMQLVPLRLLAMFFGGSALWIVRSRIRLSGRLVLLCSAVMGMAAGHIRLFFIVYTLTIPYLVIYAAYAPTPRLWVFNRIGDYSYGIYIYAFPVQQSIASLLPGIKVGEMFLLAWTVALVPAVLSWHFVEKPMLRLK